MKTLERLSLLLGSAVLLAWASSSAPAADLEHPYALIRSVQIQKPNLVVEVEASTLFTSITLESTTRVDRKTWEPRAVESLANFDGLIARVTFRIPLSSSMEILRVRGETSAALPQHFFEGTNKFVSATGPGGGFTGGLDGRGDLNTAPTAEGGAGGESARAVVESDIWKIDGDTLYFFNNYRGLQVLDISNPDAPIIKGAYEIPASGEQMYLVSPGKVALLARDSCSWNGASKIVLLDTTGGDPKLVAELAVQGRIEESRLVGSALYVVTANYREIIVQSGSSTVPGHSWESVNEIYSFDLSDFEAPLPRSRDASTGYSQAIMATDKFLCVSQNDYSSGNWYHSNIQLYDISSPDGTMRKVSTIPVAGLVKDKFKMNIDGTVLSVVSQQQSVSGWPTVVETFSLADPTQPQRLGSLKIIENEQLHATRFSGKLLYAVTFLRIDPLWIIDLSNPSAPRKVGELEIPGFSTYIHPLGGKLLTIGYENTEGWRTSVQLFNVENPSNPSLLSKILLGDSYSGSEANYDEKAFGVLPEQKLVLVPFHGYVNKEWITGVQIIDLDADRLVKRGVIEQQFTPRRATFHRDRLLSVSARELLTIKASDRDHPEVIQTTELSWATEKVHLVGQHLIEVDSYSGTGPALHIVAAEDPTRLLSRHPLGNIPYLGSAVRGDKLYVLQGRSRQLIYPEVWNPTNWFPIGTNPPVVVATAFDLSKLPALSKLSETTSDSGEEYYWGRYEPLWVRNDLVVWASQNQNYWWGRWDFIALPGREVVAADSAVGRAAPMDGSIIGPWYGGSVGHFIALDLSGQAPAFGAEVKLTGTNNWWSFGEAATANGLVFTSHLASEYDTTIDPPPYTYNYYDGSQWVTVTNDPPPGVWVQRYYLDVIDYADAEDPLVRKPVNIPGSLMGIDRGGQVLFTRGYDRVWNHNQSLKETINALAYNGLEARLISQLELPQTWPRPAIADGGFIYLGSPADTNKPSPSLQVWNLPDDGKFALVGSLNVAAAPYQLFKFGDLLVAQNQTLELFDATRPGALTRLGSGAPQVCYGTVLDGAAGDVTRGLWVPLGWYGVIKIGLGAEPPPPPSSSQRSIASVNPSVIAVTVSPAADVASYFVEEILPGGFRAEGITDEGVFEGGKLRWGPFQDHNARTLKYTLIPPVDFAGTVPLTGNATFDGTEVTTTGLSWIRFIIPSSRAERSITTTTSSASVTVQVTPRAGTASYTVEERLQPAITVNSVTEGGTFDPVTGTIRWSFNDGTQRWLRYTATPAPEFTGTVTFKGSANFDGAALTIIGAESVTFTSSIRSKADREINGSTISIKVSPRSDVAAYAVEERIPAGFSAAEINNEGEFDTATRKVKWGIFLDSGARTLTYKLIPPAGFQGVALVHGNASFDGSLVAIGGPNEVRFSSPPPPTRAERVISDLAISIKVTPPVGTAAYALEETLPSGFSATSVNEAGVWDAANRKVKWGLFLDDRERTLTYTLVPPADFSGTAQLTGLANFDGTDARVAGASEVSVNNPDGSTTP